MTRRIISIIFLCLHLASFGQTVATKKIATTFYQLDKLKRSDSTLRVMHITEIKYNDNNILDTLKSIAFLDSMHWFLTRHLDVVVEIGLWKNGKFADKDEVAKYLIRQGVDKQRINPKSVCSITNLSMDDKKIPTTKTDNQTYTLFKVLSDDFVDPNAPKQDK